jgi:hypothetical protein
VEDLEHLINFFEHNLDKNYVDNTINESDQNKLDILNKNAQDFIMLQYEIIVERYKIYCEKIRNCFNNIFPNSSDADLGKKYNFINFLIT